MTKDTNALKHAVAFWRGLTGTEHMAQRLKLQDCIVGDLKLTAAALRVSWLLSGRYLQCDPAHKHCGLAWPAYETIAADLSLNRSTAVRAVGVLCSAGWWFKFDRTGKRNTCFLWPNWERVARVTPFAQRVASVHSKGGTDAPQRVASLLPESLLANLSYESQLASPLAEAAKEILGRHGERVLGELLDVVGEDRASDILSRAQSKDHPAAYVRAIVKSEKQNPQRQQPEGHVYTPQPDLPEDLAAKRRELKGLEA